MLPFAFSTKGIQLPHFQTCESLQFQENKLLTSLHEKFATVIPLHWKMSLASLTVYYKDGYFAEGITRKRFWFLDGSPEKTESNAIPESVFPTRKFFPMKH